MLQKGFPDPFAAGMNPAPAALNKIFRTIAPPPVRKPKIAELNPVRIPIAAIPSPHTAQTIRRGFFTSFASLRTKKKGASRNCSPYCAVCAATNEKFPGHVRSFIKV